MNPTYKMVTLVGCSATSYEDAIQRAITDAAKTLRHLGWFEVVELRGRIDGAEVVEYQAKVQVGLRVEA